MTGDVLVLRALGLGDALTGVAALRGVRRAWPDRRLVLAAPAASGHWLRALGVVDDVLPTTGLGQPLRWSGSGHVAVDLHGRGPTSHDLLLATQPARLVAFGTGRHLGPRWRADEHEVDRWCRLVRGAGGPCDRPDLRLALPEDVEPSEEVLVHPGAAAASRRWPQARWSALVRRLLVEGLAVAVTGGEDERDLCAAVCRGAAPTTSPRGGGPRARRRAGLRVTNLAGRLTLGDLARRVAGARLLVCGDTGVAHLATALGTRSVLLFGPVSPARWGPAVDLDRHSVLWHGEPWRPGDPYGGAVDAALAAIDVDEVWSAVGRQLDRSDARTGPTDATWSSPLAVSGR